VVGYLAIIVQVCFREATTLLFCLSTLQRGLSGTSSAKQTSAVRFSHQLTSTLVVFCLVFGLDTRKELKQGSDQRNTEIKSNCCNLVLLAGNHL
jgi:hypothetical protein